LQKIENPTVKYTVKAAARATGISESRLRTWERRYGIPKPSRSATRRRLYDEADLQVIRRMAALVDAGISAADAADAVRSGEAATFNGETPPLEHPLIAAMTEAAEAYDESAFVAAVRAAVDQLGWGQAFDEVVFPALKRIGSFWEAASLPPAKEHFASELVRREIAAAVTDLAAPSGDGPLLVLATPESERHDLGLAALNLLLRMDGARVVYLGPDVPTVDLLDVWQTLQPDAICLSATTASGLASLVRASRTLVASRRVRVFVGGPAVSPSNAEAAGTRLPESLAAASRLIIETLTIG
jgi:DNA-binding transcriptional MerR regulator/methylmalonyl-CoA mutase cobalamin-binding subunit